MVRKKRSRLGRLLSFNQHRKRFGARKAGAELMQNDFNALREQIIEGDELVYTHGSSKHLETHFKALRDEFVGQSELAYLHARLIVLLRREYKVKETYAEFLRLWQEQGEFLLDELNTRWLMSAADTFADHAQEPVTRAVAFAVSCLLNTVKMQETERYFLATEDAEPDAERIAILQERRVALFDGISGFAVGTDDTLRNMRWRLDEIAKYEPVGPILKTVFLRLQEHDTVYKRLRDLHTRDKTAWW